MAGVPDRPQNLTIVTVAIGQTASTRAKDSDRTDTCQILDTALAEGQLSMSEHADRVKAADIVKHDGDGREVPAKLELGVAKR